MVLRTFGKNKNMPEKQKLHEVFFLAIWTSQRNQKFDGKKPLTLFGCFEAVEQRHRAQSQGSMDPSLLSSGGVWKPDGFPGTHEAMGTFLMSPEKKKTKHFKQRRPSNDGHPIFCWAFF